MLPSPDDAVAWHAVRRDAERQLQAFPARFLYWPIQNLRRVNERRTPTVRIWDVPPAILCRQHLLGEHRELHALWHILTLDKTGYRRHPETVRWVGKLGALYQRHEALVTEMTRRGYNHASPLDPALATGETAQTAYVDAPARQLELLLAKGCACRLDSAEALALLDTVIVTPSSPAPALPVAPE